MAANFKQKQIRLDEEEFEELPRFALKNMKDFAMFEDYLEADMIIEVTRAFKIQVMDEIQKHLLPPDRQILDGLPLAEL